MSNELALSSGKKTHVIQTFGGSAYFITADQHLKLTRLGLQDTMNIDGNLIKGSAVSEVCTLEDYYRNHPDKRPEETNYTINSVESLEAALSAFTPERKLRAMQHIVEGFKSHFEGRPIPPNSQAMLDKMIERLSNLKI